MHCNEMSSLGESIYDNPNEVHTNVIPLPHGYRQRLEYTCRLQMACFHLVASIALGYILGYINLHVEPPESLFQIFVHLGTAGINREFGHMILIKDGLLNFRIDRNHKASSKPDHILVILLETCVLGISLC
jgi:hypothetical protein